MNATPSGETQWVINYSNYDFSVINVFISLSKAINEIMGEFCRQLFCNRRNSNVVI